MIRYAGNLEFREQPGATGPSQAESGLDTLVRTFKGKTIDKYTLFNITLGSPDRQFPQLFATNVEPVDLEGGLTEFRVTYKGMLSGVSQQPTVSDAIVIKSGSVNAQYVYERLESFSGQWLFQTFLDDRVPNLIPTWRERAVEIQANVSYYARSTTYNYVRRDRPSGPQYRSFGVNGFGETTEIFNTTPSGSVQVPRFPNINYALAITGDAASNFEWQRFLRDSTEIRDAEMRYKRLTITQSDKDIICSNFTAERQGLWWVCSETWEVELRPIIDNPTPDT